MAKFSKRLLGIVLILAASNIAARTGGKSPIELDVEWRLSLDAHGEIVRLAPAGEKVLPVVRKQLASIVRGWHFTPGKINGQPAATETTLHVRVALDEASLGDYRMRVLSAATGTFYRHRIAPKYPKEALRFGYEGKV
jgi:hypothetical protein